MWPALIGCNVPFTILLLVAIGSIVCSFVIGTDELIPIKRVQAPKWCPMTTSSSLMDKQFHKLNIKSEKIFSILASSKHDSHSEPPFPSKNQPISDHKINPFVINDDLSPPISLTSLRKKFGTRKNFWGDWTNSQTRDFYQTHLPRALQSKLSVFVRF